MTVISGVGTGMGSEQEINQERFLQVKRLIEPSGVRGTDMASSQHDRLVIHVFLALLFLFSTGLETSTQASGLESPSQAAEASTPQPTPTPDMQQRGLEQEKL